MASRPQVDLELAAFLEHRPLLFSIAYRMMASVVDAEDIVQEAYLRWTTAVSKQDVRNAKSLLVAITTRLCIDEWKKARRKREVYIGSNLPEPIPTTMLQPATQDDRIDFAFLLLLEQLKPIERAVFLLKQVFDYSYSEIAAIVKKSEVACRQICSRARRSINVNCKPTVTEKRQEQLLQKYLEAIMAGDGRLLLSIINSDAQLVSDGGGIVHSSRRRLNGRIAISAFLFGIIRKAHYSRIQLYKASINNMPAIVIYESNRPVMLQCFDTAATIQTVYSIQNPYKLALFMKRDNLISTGVLKPVRLGIQIQLQWFWNRIVNQKITAPMLRIMQNHMS